MNRHGGRLRRRVIPGQLVSERSRSPMTNGDVDVLRNTVL